MLRSLKALFRQQPLTFPLTFLPGLALKGSSPTSPCVPTPCTTAVMAESLPVVFWLVLPVLSSCSEEASLE